MGKYLFTTKEEEHSKWVFAKYFGNRWSHGVITRWDRFRRFFVWPLDGLVHSDCNFIALVRIWMSLDFKETILHVNITWSEWGKQKLKLMKFTQAAFIQHIALILKTYTSNHERVLSCKTRLNNICVVINTRLSIETDYRWYTVGYNLVIYWST